MPRDSEANDLLLRSTTASVCWRALVLLGFGLSACQPDEGPDLSKLSMAAGTMSYESWDDFFENYPPPQSSNDTVAIVEHAGQGAFGIDRDAVQTYTGWDRNGNGAWDPGDFVATGNNNNLRDYPPDYDHEDYSEAVARSSDGSAGFALVQRDVLGWFHHSAPDPIDSLQDGFTVVPATAQVHLDDLQPYIQRWIDSRIGDKFSAYAFKNIYEIRLSSWSSPSFFDKERRTLWISTRDKDHYGVVAIDHELMLAGLYLGFVDGVIDWSRYRQLARLNWRRFSQLNGYVGSIRWTWTANQNGGKSFMTGQQYRKLRWNLNNHTLNATDEAHARRYLGDLESNILVSHTSDGKPVHMIKTNASAADIDGYLSEFTSNQSQTHQEIEAVVASYPWPLWPQVESTPGQDLRNACLKDNVYGRQLCGRKCVNITYDVNHCGGCGFTCQGGQECRRGVCDWY